MERVTRGHWNCLRGSGMPVAGLNIFQTTVVCPSDVISSLYCMDCVFLLRIVVRGVVVRRVVEGHYGYERFLRGSQ